MTSFRKNVAIITICIVVVISLACNPNKKNMDYLQAASLARTLSYEKIVSGLESHDWSKEQDPALLMLYCEALAETGHKLPATVLSETMPHRVRQFVIGYYHLVTGDRRAALNIFLELANAARNQDKVWGLIGILDHAFYTEIISNMAGPLNVIKRIAETESAITPSWVLPYYQSYFELYSGNYSVLESFIQKNRSNLEADVYFDIYMQLLIRQSRFDEAKKTLGSLDPELRESQMMLLHEAEIIWLQMGATESQEFLKKKLQQNPKRWLLRQKYANLLVDEGKASEGLSFLRKLANERPFDVFTQLAFAEQLIYQGQIKKAQEIIHKKLGNPVELPYYNIIFARLFFAEGSLNESREAVKRALTFYPKSYDALWVEFQIEEKIGNYAKAERVIKQILELEPDGINALVELMELNFLKQNWNAVLQIKKRIDATNRYIEPEVREKINDFIRRISRAG